MRKKNLSYLLKVLLCLSILIYISKPSKAQIKFDIKKDFKAKGDGISDDTKAFEEAALAISKLHKPCVLLIPSGRYSVGSQQPYYKYKKFPQISTTIFHLKGAKNVTIKGVANQSIIICKEGMYYGSFHQDGKPMVEKEIKRPFLDNEASASLFTVFRIEECNNVNISSVILNGNMYPGKQIIGGGYGDAGNQLHHFGLYILNSNKVKVSNCEFTRFGLDGIYLWNAYLPQYNDGIIIDKCISTYNGRQAISVCSGMNISIKNSEFSNTGKGIISSLPGAGIDIEPEDVHGKAFVENCKIENCKIVNNSGPGILFSSISASNNTNINNCTIVGTTNFAIWTQQKSVTYTNCKIYGSAVHNYPATSFNDPNKTNYKNCYFSDTNQNSKNKAINKLFIYNDYLISASMSDYASYENCTLKSSFSKLIWLNTSLNKSSYNLKNCNLETSIKINDAIWIPNAEVDNCRFLIPKGTLHYGLNFNSGKSKLSKSLVSYIN